VGDGEVYMLRPLLGDGDAVGAHIVGVKAALAAHRGDHGVPTGFDKFRLAVDALADLVEDVIIIADRFAGLRVNVVEGLVGVLHCDAQYTAVEIGRAVGSLGDLGLITRDTGSSAAW